MKFFNKVQIRPNEMDEGSIFGGGTSKSSQCAAIQIKRLTLYTDNLAVYTTGAQPGFWRGGGPVLGHSTERESRGVPPRNILKNLHAIWCIILHLLHKIFFSFGGLDPNAAPLHLVPFRIGCHSIFR